MNIGLAIKLVRNDLGISQEELSARTSISQTSISQFENGKKHPSKKTIKKVSEVLNIPEAILYIIGIEDTDVPSARKKMFDSLYPEIKNLALQIIGKRKSKHATSNLKRPKLVKK